MIAKRAWLTLLTPFLVSSPVSLGSALDAPWLVAWPAWATQGALVVWLTIGWMIGMVFAIAALDRIVRCLRYFSDDARQERRSRDLRDGVCPACGYDTRGLPAPRCPECGEVLLADVCECEDVRRVKNVGARRIERDNSRARRPREANDPSCPRPSSTSCSTSPRSPTIRGTSGARASRPRARST